MSSTRIRRRVATLVAATIATIGLALSQGGTAQAANQAFFSGFESGDGSAWQFTASGPGRSFVDFGAHTGSLRATMTMSGTGFTSVGHRVHLTAGTACMLQGFIKPESSGSSAINMEVLNPTDLGYIALRTLTFTGSGPYQPFFLFWTKGQTDVLIRFSLGSTGTVTKAGLDDVLVTCV